MPFFPQFSNLFVAPYVPLSLTDGLASYWKLDDNSWIDSGGNNRTLTSLNETSNTNGIINDGALFDAASEQYLTYEEYPFTSDFSISVWLKCDVQSTYSAAVALVGGTLNFGLYINASDVDGKFGVYANGWNASESVINDNEWHHLVATISGGNVLKAYVDGGMVIDEITGNYYQPQTAALYIGFNSSVYFLSGIVDEVGIWNKALSQSDVGSLYNGGAGITYPFTE